MFNARSRQESSNEKVGGDVEEIGEFAGLGFADGAFAVEDFGGDALGAEDFPEIFLGEVASFHQVMEGLAGGGLADREAALFVAVDQDGQEFGKFVFFGSGVFQFVETQEFVGETVVLIVGADHVGKGAAQEAAVGLVVEFNRRLHSGSGRGGGL